MGKARNIADSNLTSLAVDSNTLVVDSTNDRVGVGTSSPAGKLDVLSSSNLVSNFNSSDTTNGGYIRFQNSGTSIGDIGSGKNVVSGGAIGDLGISSRSGNLVIGTGSTERVRIDASGNVGIGTTTPTNKLTSVYSGSSTAVTDYVFIGGSDTYRMIGLSEDTANNAFAITNKYSVINIGKDRIRNQGMI
jgi:hypothetical protein